MADLSFKPIVHAKSTYFVPAWLTACSLGAYGLAYGPSSWCLRLRCLVYAVLAFLRGAGRKVRGASLCVPTGPQRSVRAMEEGRGCRVDVSWESNTLRC